MLLRSPARLLFARRAVRSSSLRACSGSSVPEIEEKQQISKRETANFNIFALDIHEARERRLSFNYDHPADHPKLVVRRMEVEFIDKLLQAHDKELQITVDQLFLIYRDIINKYENDELSDQLIVDTLTQFLAMYDMQWIKTRVVPLMLQVTERLGKFSARVCCSCILAYSHHQSLTSDIDEFVSKAYQRLLDTSQTNNLFPVRAMDLAVTRVVAMSSSWQMLTAETLQQSDRTFAVTNKLVNKAAVEKDFDTAFKLLQSGDMDVEKLLRINSYRPYDSSLATLLSNMTSHRLPNLLSILASMELEINEQHSSLIMEKWNELCSEGQKGAAITTLNDNGECRNCNTKLDDSILTAEELEVLKCAFYEKSIIEGGIYKVSEPKTFKRFNRLLSQQEPYDLVIDGMNAFHCHSKTPFKVNLKRHMVQQVRDLAAGGKRRILVTIRQHALHWIPGQLSGLIDTHVINNSFEDDVFTLYATLCSGPHCHILSSDDFSDHFCALLEMKDKKAYSTLIRWLRTRRMLRTQDMLTLRGIDVFKNVDRDGKSLGKYTTPLETAIKPQRHAGCWHLPLHHSLLPLSKPRWSDMQQWLCLPGATGHS